MPKIDYAKIHAEANRAAKAAHEGIPDTGAVGFAWITVAPGTSGFARWLRNNTSATSAQSGLYRGTRLSFHTGKQSISANYAAAEAYAKVASDLLPDDVSVQPFMRFD